VAFPPATPVVDGTTVFGNAWWTLVLAELATALQDAGHPTVTPADIIAELIAARGNTASLPARLANSIDINGNPLNQTLPSMMRNGHPYGNVALNDTMQMWSRGDTAAPDFWAFTGTGGAIQRCGVGQADTKVIPNQDHFSARLTYGSDPARLTQYPIISTLSISARSDHPYIPVDSNASPVPGYDSTDLAGWTAYAIGHVWCDGTNRARVYGSGGLGNSYSEYHPGDSQWHTLITPVSFGTQMAFGCSVESAGAAYFQCVGLVFLPSTMAPMWMPARVRYGAHVVRVLGNPASGTLDFWQPPRPVHIVGCQMSCITAPTGSQPTIDLLTPIGGAFASMFVTLPTIAASKLTGMLQVPNPAAANYRRRTIRGLYSAGDAALQDNSIMKMVYVDDGSSTLQDLIVRVNYVEYNPPLEQFRGMTDLSEVA
jgi:hypothetical protein